MVLERRGRAGGKTLIDARFEHTAEGVFDTLGKRGTVTRGLITKRSIHTRFLRAVGHNLYVVWPVLFAVLAWQLAIGFLITWLAHWSLGDGVYFTFVTAATSLPRRMASVKPRPVSSPGA